MTFSDGRSVNGFWRYLKRIVCGIAIAFSAVVLIASTAAGQNFPKPQGFVNDFAGMISSGAKAQLEEELVNFEKETSAEIAVATVNSLEGYTVEDYAARLFEAWGIGKKDKDNGVLLLVAKEERKVRIEVGYGLEPVITDGRAGGILDDMVVPEFKEGNYEQGIINGVKAIEVYIRLGTPPEPLSENPVNDILGDHIVVLGILGIITMYLIGFMARTKSIWLGAVWGIIVGVILGLSWGSLLMTILMPFGTGGMGLGLDYLLSRNYKKRKGKGLSTGWFSSGGGFSGGGSSSGSSHSGGFGGGSSGGGGASRGW